MPRQYKRKTDNGLIPHDQMLEAIKLVMVGGKSIRSVSKDKGIAKSVLARYVEKYKNDPNCSLTPNYTHSQVFTAEQEESLEEYLLTSSKMFHGLTPQKTRQLAFQMALINGLKMPETWESNHMAGEAWLSGFLSRHPNLAIRTPEATSLARAAAFNKPNIAKFFDILNGVVTKHNIVGRNILNLDESGITTVQKVPKVISQKGSKQVGQVTSAERGELVTICGIISATGQSIPPAFVFPRKNYRDIMLNGAPEGSLGLVSESGWMTAEIFLQVMEHVVRHTQASRENQVVLIMDNHESHISLDALTYAKAQGVHVVTLPPHTSHKTQPLDITVFGPMKTNYSTAANSWMLRNPGRSITIYQLAELVGEAWTKAACPTNIMSGFKATGIWPLNPNVFSEGSFMPSSVTDRPAPVQPTNTVQITIPDLDPSPSTVESPPPAAVLPQTHTLLPSSVTNLPSQGRPAVPVALSKPSPNTIQVTIPETDPSPSTSGSQPPTLVLPETHALIHTGQASLPSESAHLDFITPEKHHGYPKVSISILHDLVL